jgi:hypothetical protein
VESPLPGARGRYSSVHIPLGVSRTALVTGEGVEPPEPKPQVYSLLVSPMTSPARIVPYVGNDGFEPPTTRDVNAVLCR